MNILSVIGTRPQYIKIKPFYDYCLNNEIKHTIIDTNQHYSYSVSDIFIKELNLDITYNIQANSHNEITFISDCMNKLYDIYTKEKPNFILVYGDTNSTVSASIVANKMHIPFGHVESGIRCYDKNRPEEINRILVDDIANIHFLSRKKDKKNVSNGIFCGDLEYYYLHQLKKQKILPKITNNNYYIMTIHRAENTNYDNLNGIIKSCEKSHKQIIFPIHHRTKKVIEQYNISIPNNIKIIEPLNYMQTINLLSYCSGVISDSGGLTKICPFFGKKCLIPLKTNEWKEVVDYNFAKLNLDFDWLNNNDNIQSNQNLYYNKNTCKIIVNTIKNYLNI